MRLRKLVKRSLAAAAYYSGFAWVCLALLLRKRAVVLMYHRVLPQQPPADAFSTDAIVVTPPTFDRHLRFMRRFCNPVGIEEFRAMIYGEAPWRPRTCLVTFDDGWFDNAEHALPALERHAVPATVFVATGYIGSSDTFWQERLLRLLYTAWTRGERSRALLTEMRAAHVLQLPEHEARVQLRGLVTELKSQPRSAVRELIARVRLGLDLADDSGSCGDDRFMTWAQVAELEHGRSFTVESHAHSHVPLTAIEPAAVREELRRSREELETRLAKSVRFLAYPNGDHDLQVAALARESGYQLAFTTVPGAVAPGDDPLRLRRINVAEDGTDSNAGFLCRMLGWW